MDELRRLLVWTSFHVCCAELESNNNTRPPFVSIPYAPVFASKGTIPNSSVEEKLGGKMMIINRAVTTVTNQLKEALDFTTRKQRILKGTSFSPSNLQEYLKEHIILEGDKYDTMNIVSVKSYVREAESHMFERFNRSCVYHRLGGTNTYDHWLSQTCGWKSKVESFLLPYLPQILCDFGVFFDACKVLRLPRFRSLAKTHNSRVIKLGRFPSRPIVGMSMACTTRCSVLTGIAGQILLKIERKMQPLATPVCDTYDLLDRVRKQLTKLQADGVNEVALSVFDFNALYTRVTWEHLMRAFAWWRSWFLSLQPDQLCVSDVDIAFIKAMFGPVNSEDLNHLCEQLPYMECHRADQDALCLGLALLDYVYHHGVFVDPRIGICLQRVGFTMGTNAAPPWAQLVLRMFEILTPLPNNHFVNRYIDHGLILHPLEYCSELEQALPGLYPPDLRSGMEHVGQTTKVVFLDVCFMSLKHQTTCVHWKDTHACQYFPWDSNVPGHIRVALVRGEFFRYIRICSHPHLYQVCCERLVSALRWLNYPWEAIQSNHIPWGARNRFRTLRCDLVPAGALNEPMSLSQSEVMCCRQHGAMGGGREPFGQVHVLKVSHHGAIPVAWSRAMHVLKRRLKFLPDLKLFVILSPLRNLQCLYRNSGLISLSNRQQV